MLGAIASADDGPRYPALHGELAGEFQSDWSYKSNDVADEVTDLYFTLEPSFSLQFTPHLSLETGAVMEPVADPLGGNRYVEQQGLFIQTLFLQYATERWGVHVGKLNPAFGLAWDAAPGLYGTDYAEEYELTERLGLGGYWNFATERFGSHQLTFDAFFMDTTLLTGSVIESRDKVRRSDGGPSNTGDPRSFSFTLQGEESSRVPGLGYHFSFAHQAGPDDERDEESMAAALIYGFSPYKEVEIEVLGEYVLQINAAGGDATHHFFTQSASATWRGFNAAISYTLRDLRDDPFVADNADGVDHLFHISAGYEFSFGANIQVGWRLAQEQGARTDGVGVLVGYSYDF